MADSSSWAVSSDVSEELGWMRDGLCYGAVRDGSVEDPWFPPEQRPNSNRVIPPETLALESAAYEACAGCFVIDRCNDYAVVRPELRGVWGGRLTHQREKERRRIGRSRAHARNRGATCPPGDVREQRSA